MLSTAKAFPARLALAAFLALPAQFAHASDTQILEVWKDPNCGCCQAWVDHLSEKPRVHGLAVPGMPLGSPGMETPDGDKEAYDVLSFDESGNAAVWSSHNN